MALNTRGARICGLHINDVPMHDLVGVRAYRSDAERGSDELRERTMQLFQRHGLRIGATWDQAGARLLAGLSK